MMRAIGTGSRAIKQILYIDQSEDCRRLLTILLEAVGYEVNTAMTIASGIRIIKLQLFDLFILESSYIDGPGTDLCRYIRTLHPHAPIIFFSTSADHSDIKAAMACWRDLLLNQTNGHPNYRTNDYRLAWQARKNASLSLRRKIPT